MAAFKAGDYQAAFKEFLPLADQGNPEAQYTIGFMYDRGKGLMQNDVEAVKWYRLAADQGMPKAQFNIGLIRQNGEGFIQSNVMAHMWFNIASANGAENSAKRRDEIAAKKTREEIAKAQAMA